MLQIVTGTRDTMPKIPLLLLKTQTATDGYVEYFAKEGIYRPIFVPVLEHRFHKEHLSLLGSQIQNGAFADTVTNTNSSEVPKYGGLIFTSQRAVEAFASVVHGLRQQEFDVSSAFSSNLPAYVVGPATARGVRALKLPCRILGEETGNGDALAQYILANYGVDRAHPLLFPVGEQRRDIIPKTLQSESLPNEQRIGVQELTVYETGEMASFREDFSHALSDARVENESKQWVVVFSPTGCRDMLDGIGLCGSDARITNDVACRQRTTMIATIGPTTKAYLQSQFGFEPDVCAAKPSPEGLSEVIQESSCSVGFLCTQPFPTRT